MVPLFPITFNKFDSFSNRFVQFSAYNLPQRVPFSIAVFANHCSNSRSPTSQE